MVGDEQQSYKEISRQVISFAMQVIEQKGFREKQKKRTRLAKFADFVLLIFFT